MNRLEGPFTQTWLLKNLPLTFKKAAIQWRVALQVFLQE